MTVMREVFCLHLVTRALLPLGISVAGEPQPTATREPCNGHGDDDRVIDDVMQPLSLQLFRPEA